MNFKPTDSIISTGIAAKKLGVSPRLLIKYEKTGLILPHRTKSARRLYSCRDLEWLDFIHKQIIENNMKVAYFHLLLALIPCWKVKTECSITECKGCMAYNNYNDICWTINEQGSRVCREQDCRKCDVYHYATNAENILKMHAEVDLKK